MCSFLLLFLILIVGFDLLRDSAPHWNAEASSSTLETRGPESSVLASYRCIDLVSLGPHQIEENFSSTPFQRSTFHQEDGFTNRTTRALAMAMRSLPTDQQKDSYEVCSMQCTLDEWNSSQYPTKAVCKPSGRCNALARLGRMVSGLGRQLGRSARSLAVDERQISGEIPLTSKQQKQQIRTASDQRSQEQEQREGKRKIRKRCWQRNDGIQSEPFALCSPSSRNATLATIGEQHQCPNANSGANLCSTGDRGQLPKGEKC